MSNRESARKVGSFIRRKKKIVQEYNYTCQVCGFCLIKEIENFEKLEKPRFLSDPKLGLKMYYKTRSVLLSKIQTHHILPLSNGGRNNKDNLLIVCKVCHDEIHKMEKSDEDSVILKCFNCNKLFSRKKVAYKKSSKYFCASECYKVFLKQSKELNIKIIE